MGHCCKEDPKQEWKPDKGQAGQVHGGQEEMPDHEQHPLQPHGSH